MSSREQRRALRRATSKAMNLADVIGCVRCDAAGEIDVRNWYATPCVLPVAETRLQIWTGTKWRNCSKAGMQRVARWRELLLLPRTQ